MNFNFDILVGVILCIVGFSLYKLGNVDGIILMLAGSTWALSARINVCKNLIHELELEVRRLTDKNQV